MHHTAPYMHHTMYGACMVHFWGIYNSFKYFENTVLRTNFLNFPFSLFFFKNCSSQFRNWIVFTYFCSMYKLYCVVRFTVLMYGMFIFDLSLVDLFYCFTSFILFIKTIIKHNNRRHGGMIPYEKAVQIGRIPVKQTRTVRAAAAANKSTSSI